MHYSTWCSCNFCVEKWAGTRYIGYTPFPFIKYQEELGKLRQIPCHDIDTIDVAKEIVRKERERKKKVVRQKLKERRDEIL